MWIPVVAHEKFDERDLGVASGIWVLVVSFKRPSGRPGEVSSGASVDGTTLVAPPWQVRGGATGVNSRVIAPQTDQRRNGVVPPAGFEPALMASEANDPAKTYVQEETTVTEQS